MAEPTMAPLKLPEVVEETLATGLQVAAAERGCVPLAAACLVFPAGSARDPQARAGLTDFMLELLRRGTKKRTAAKIDGELERMGADVRVETGPDTSAITATAPSERLPELLALLADLLTTPTFPQGEVANARTRQLAALENDRDDPSTLASDALLRAALSGHPYGRPGRGIARDVARFDRRACVERFQAFVRPAGAHLVLVGDLPPEESLAMARKALARWAGTGDGLMPLPPVPPLSGIRVVVVPREGSNQAQLRLASMGPSRRDPDVVAARLSCQVLGGSFTSRLMEALRVNRGLTYGVSAHLTEAEAGGLTVVSSFTKTSTARELVDVALAEIKRFRDEGPEAQELERAKRYSCGLYPLSLETADQLARALADQRRYGRPADWLATYREKLQAVTVGEVREQARRHFFPDGVAIAAVGEAKALAKQLAPLGPVQVIPRFENRVIGSVLYEDSALLAVDKPAGMLTVRGREGEREPSLVDELSALRKEKLWVVHRLDRGTSGVLVLARTADAHRALNRAFEEGRVQKRYLALVRGEPPRDSFDVDVALVPARRGKTRPAAEGETGKPAHTSVTVMERLRGFALLEVRPRTGRPHQVRVHLRFVGHPLAVDPAYGSTEKLTRGDLGLAPAEEILLARTPLHAASLKLAHPVTAAELAIQAPLPADFAAVLEAMRSRSSDR